MTRNQALIFHWRSPSSLDYTTIYLFSYTQCHCHPFVRLHFAKWMVCHILGMENPEDWVYDPEIWTQWRFCTMHLPTKFNCSKLSCWQINKLDSICWFCTGAASRLRTTNMFTYIVNDSHAHQSHACPRFIYLVQNVWFATFWGQELPKMGPVSVKFELSRDLCTVHLPPPSFIILYHLIIQKLSCC